jgi:hypothetical protein
LLPLLINEGNITKSNATLNLICSSNEVDQEYCDYYSILIDLKSQNKDFKLLDSTQKAKLEQIANSSSPMKSMAQSYLGLVYDAKFANVYVSDTVLNRPIASGINLESSERGNRKSEISISPNPVNTYLSIDKSQLKISADRKIVVNIIDISGRIIFEKEISSVNNIETIDVSNLENGYYLINIYSNGVVLHKSKIQKSM